MASISHRHFILTGVGFHVLTFRRKYNRPVTREEAIRYTVSLNAVVCSRTRGGVSIWMPAKIRAALLLAALRADYIQTPGI